MFRSQKVTQGLPYSFAVGIILFQKILLALIDLSAASFSKGPFNDFQNLIFLIGSGCILPDDSPGAEFFLMLSRVNLQHHFSEIIQFTTVEIQVGSVYRANTGIPAEEIQHSIRSRADHGNGQAFL